MKLFLNRTTVEDEFLVNLELIYKDVYDIKLSSEFENPFIGEYSVSIENEGTYTNSKPVIVLTVR